MDSLQLISQALDPLAGKRVLDVGCGPGYLAKALLARRAEVTGIDPAEETIAAARNTAPGAAFEVASGEALPFEDAAFDGVVLLNSLHHVPEQRMEACLIESGRVAAPGGRVVVIEPLAEGSFFEAFRVIENETAVRAAAQRAIAAVLERGAFERIERVDYVRREAFDGMEQFLARAAAADRSREGIIRERRAEIEQALHAAASRDERGRFLLEQPLRAEVLAARR